MESEYPFFCFPLIYAADAIVCKVIMKDQNYDIYFDDRHMGKLAHTDSFTWVQFSGVILPESVVNEIGLKIESEYY